MGHLLDGILGFSRARLSNEAGDWEDEEAKKKELEENEEDENNDKKEIHVKKNELKQRAVD